MIDTSTAYQFDVAPEDALGVLRHHSGLLLIDLDETLYLRNSTEDFIDCARPAWLAALILRALEILKPWRTTGQGTRDNWRTAAVAVLFPWTWWRWKSRVGILAGRHANSELSNILKSRSEPFVILTAGFGTIVVPLLRAMGFGHARILAARMFSCADRRDGKLAMATRVLGQSAVAESLVLTDSLADHELMSACKTPVRTCWPTARYVKAHSGTYLPGEYVSRVKHPGKRYFGSILREDFSFWVLCSIGLATNPAAHFVGLLLLLLSFWSIYERGYLDNDLMAESWEIDPKLTKEYSTETFSISMVQPWIWALACGAAGVAILHPHKDAFLQYCGVWAAVLVCVHFCFRLYNRLDKQTRLWIYPLLQVGRTASFALVVAIEPAGIAALSAHIVSRWVPYLSYRLGRSMEWPEFPTALIRLIAFMLFSVMVCLALGPKALFAWTTLALLAWNVFIARREIYRAIKASHRIDRS